jgi:purine-binding chemotaxis protein CheW
VSTDWKELHRRLETTAEALARAAAPSTEERRSILKNRARALAREPERIETAGKSLDLVEFRLGPEVYAVECAFVREVSSVKDLTQLPAAPPFVLGIINLRGQILSVVDLRVFFDLPRSGLGDLNKVIVLSGNSMEFGILADAIIGTRTIRRSVIQPPIPTLTGIGVEYLTGIDGDGIVILDAKRILEDEKIIVAEDV